MNIDDNLEIKKDNYKKKKSFLNSLLFKKLFVIFVFLFFVFGIINIIFLVSISQDVTKMAKSANNLNKKIEYINSVDDCVIKEILKKNNDPSVQSTSETIESTL